MTKNYETLLGLYQVLRLEALLFEAEREGGLYNGVNYLL